MRSRVVASRPGWHAMNLHLGESKSASMVAAAFAAPGLAGFDCAPREDRGRAVGLLAGVLVGVRGRAREKVGDEDPARRRAHLHRPGDDVVAEGGVLSPLPLAVLVELALVAVLDHRGAT